MPAKPKSTRTSKVSTYIALLRGINVGGKNIVPMADLVRIFGEAGCVDVRHYIQSGNVVFAAEQSCDERVKTAVPEKIARRLGFKPPVVLRTAKDLARIAAENPFVAEGADLEFLHVGFLSSAPEAVQIKSLDPNRSPGDSFKIRNLEIYLNLSSGMGKTKLTNAYFDTKLQTISTFRNWRTVLKLLEMCA